MSRPHVGPILGAMVLSALLGACAPDFVDDRTVLSPTGSGGSMAIAEPLEQGSVTPTTSKPQDVVTPPPVPDPGAALEPDIHAPLPPATNRTPPSPPLWQSPPPNYNAARPDAVPLGVPSGPPASWRY